MDFPALFAEFRGKRFALLWRGSRDGFGAPDFDGRCDGHAPTPDPKAIFRRQIRADESAQFPFSICTEG
jgi:hypothetical protein